MVLKRIMLLGAAGQVGLALRHRSSLADWELGAFGHAECDITDHRAVQDAMQSFKPDLVINAAGMTNVDLCEKEQDRAVACNFEAPANLAAQCSVMDIPLIHLSTDYVFDGSESETPYKPDDKMNPLSVYGNTKMMGEESVRHEMAWHVILRISSVFSAFGNNLLTRTLKLIDERDELKIVTDQKSCPTHAAEVATALITMTNAILKGKTDGFGTFHLCGTPSVTRFEFVQEILNAYAPFTARRPKIVPAKSADFPGTAIRPAYSALDCAKIGALYGITQKPWREGLADAMQMLMRGRRKVA